MAVSGTVPSKRPLPSDPLQWARKVRRATVLVGITVLAWLFLRFTTAWVPSGMNAVPSLPPDAWCVLDKWTVGLRVGSDVFYEGPFGTMVGRVSALDANTFEVKNLDPACLMPDSATFGALPRTALLGTVVTALLPGPGESRGR
jgi:hypothetical protein